MDDVQRAELRVQILEAALQDVLGAAGSGVRHGVNVGSIGGVAAEETPLRRALEQAYRDAAAHQTDRSARIALVDRANRVRTRTLV